MGQLMPTIFRNLDSDVYLPMSWILLVDPGGLPLLLSSTEEVSPSNQDLFPRGLAWHIPHHHGQTIPVHGWRSRATVGELLWSQTKTHQVQQQFAFILRFEQFETRNCTCEFWPSEEREVISCRLKDYNTIIIQVR